MTKSVDARSITRAECERIIARIHAACEREGQSATIVIVDRGGTLKALSRSDDAIAPWAVDIATAKARTALNTNASTRQLWEEVRKEPTLTANIPYLHELTLLPGGLPIRDGEVLIGGLGVGSNARYSEDERLAEAGLREE